MNNNLKKKINKRIKYKCWHRGTKEMDFLLGKFYDKHYMALSLKELVSFENLIVSLPDEILYDCMLNKVEWPKEVTSNLLNKLKAYSNSIG